MLDTPRSVAEAAERIGFGRVERAFRPTYSVNIISVTMFLGFGAAFGVAASTITKPIGILLFAVLTTTALLLAVWAVLDTWRLIRRRFYLCEGGLLTAEHLTRLTRMIAWDDIAEIRRYYLRWYTDNGPQTMHRCRLRLTDGTSLNLEKPPLVDGQDLCEEVERRSAKARMPHILHALEAAGRADFGAITITPDGVSSPGGYALWSDISLVRLRRTRLQVWTHDGRKPVSVLIRHVPNLLNVLMILRREGLRMDLRFYRTA
ncbi:DUF6585 family protein [Micromonospora deserti]|uniref:Uncharacterized protein n=1 Tax=Micromonospora deserti TaxID=2070366 RepID=A0A2W2EAQ2_9ACTN|nr:DUF6585 family protein [Micromonospora deserti]PZG01934.1 hypothetical protein C1I99_04940 [Micromonospora deserti]